MTNKKAKQELFAARERYFTATNKAQKREAAADIEFWGNKLAWLDSKYGVQKS